MKKTEELKEFRGLESQALVQKIGEMEEELMKLHFRHGSGQLEHTAQLGSLRRRIARAKTALEQKAEVNQIAAGN